MAMPVPFMAVGGPLIVAMAMPVTVPMAVVIQETTPTQLVAGLLNFGLFRNGLNT
jgi:hypothetical protein